MKYYFKHNISSMSSSTTTISRFFLCCAYFSKCALNVGLMYCAFLASCWCIFWRPWFTMSWSEFRTLPCFFGALIQAPAGWSYSSSERFSSSSLISAMTTLLVPCLSFWVWWAYIWMIRLSAGYSATDTSHPFVAIDMTFRLYFLKISFCWEFGNWLLLLSKLIILWSNSISLLLLFSLISLLHLAEETWDYP